MKQKIYIKRKTWYSYALNKMKVFYLALFSVFLACDDSLDFDIENYNSKIVVDGYIENGQYPLVVLTKSAAYFSSIDSSSLRNLVVSRAKVTVSDGEREEILTLKKNDAYFPPYIYEGSELKGEVGKKYFLKIDYEGKIYESVTTIPPKVEFDSIWFKLAPNEDSLGLIYGRLNDDADAENYYRLFTQRLEKDQKYIPIYLSAIGDQFFNGKSFTFSILRGSESISDAVDDIYFRKGDLVRLKISTMDRTHFDFWRTLERELYVTGNPFSSSGNEIKSNISGGALGVWGGYNSAIHQLVAQ